MDFQPVIATAQVDRQQVSHPGHAGKFAGLLGRILTELAIDGTSQFPVSAFRADRPAITGTGKAPVRANSM